MPWFHKEAPSVSRPEVEQMCQRMLDESKKRLGIKEFKRVLLLPPDLTRAHSGAGWITETIYKLLPKTCDTHVIPTLGQHVPHDEATNKWMFGSIPNDRIHPHDWRKGVTRVGTVPAKVLKEKFGDKCLVDWDIPIDLNTMLMNERWDLVVNVGHVVPHEVLGFANHNKNYFIGLGGKETICAAHLAAATYGIEENLGNVVTPLRACFNWAEDNLLQRLPDVYFQVTMQRDAQQRLVHSGVFVGNDLETYLMAARLSARQNITTFDQPVKKIVAVMQADEFKATWVANKAVYRTRLAMADGGELLIIAPGLERFGEQPEVDELIRKYGYCGTPKILSLYKKNADMRDLAHATAHLMHGSSEGRFKITYAPGKIAKKDMDSVHFGYADLNETLRRYNPEKMKEGWNTMPDGERVFFISTPSAGLWSTKEKLARRETMMS
jgi:nickel-dependent lactate racemase